ncbi:MAG: glycosyltransferase family 4 protein [Verrucomicrobiota bacterium]
MNLIQITPGAGGMYCGNCFRDNALVAELRRQGHDTVMVPLYLPMTLDEAPTVGDTPTFFGGINVFLSQKMAWYRRAPAWMRRAVDAPWLLKWAAGKTAKTRPEDVGEVTVSLLRGEEGGQVREMDDKVAWRSRLPRPDAVYLSNALLLGFARRLRSALGTRVISFLQSEESFLDSLPEPFRGESWRLMAERGRELDGWIAPTGYFSGRMIARLGLSPDRVRVAPSGISLEGYRDLPERPANGFRGPSPTLGFFARMCPEKGLDTVVEAFIALRRQARFSDLRLKVGGGCGPGDVAFVESQRRRLAEAGLAGAASFHPNLSRDEKVAFLASLDVLSVPSRFSEAFGLFVVEALAAGTPVVQPDVCGFREILEATGGGRWCPDNTPESLAGVLSELLADPAALRALGDQGRRAVAEKFSDAAMAREVLTATRSLLGGAPSPEIRSPAGSTALP